jgi:modification methylase
MVTRHAIYHADARNLAFIPPNSVHLVVTSPPYGALIHYSDTAAQLGNIQSYEAFLTELDRVWAECFRILVPGGRVACVVGDICLSRRQTGRHQVLPLSADIQVRGRTLGFDNLTPIRWMKVANIKLEASTSSRFLGKPNLPNGVIKNDVEHILFLRKPGGYRKPTALQEKLSFIPTKDYMQWYAGIWTDVKGQLRKDHPAPFPLEIPRRLIKMFSFVGDTVVDPFAGTGTTTLAAIECDRNSISVELEPKYVDLIRKRLAQGSLASRVQFFPGKTLAPTEIARGA